MGIPRVGLAMQPADQGPHDTTAAVHTGYDQLLVSRMTSRRSFVAISCQWSGSKDYLQLAAARL